MKMCGLNFTYYLLFFFFWMCVCSEIQERVMCIIVSAMEQV
jgi:hypothetical protein